MIGHAERRCVVDRRDGHVVAAARAAAVDELEGHDPDPGCDPDGSHPLSDAAIVPATWVPWPSRPASWTVLSSLQKSQPWTSST